MAGTSLGTAWIQIKPTTTGITSAVKKELSKTEAEMTSSGSKVSSAFTSLGHKAGAALKVGLVAAATTATAAAVGIVKTAVQEFADYEQLVGGVDTLFKDSSSIVQGYAQEAFKTAQVSANNYMETVTGFSASLIQSLGGDTNKAAELANTAMIDMSDNMNKMGTNLESIQYAYQGFAKQNYTMLDNLKLGYGGTKKEMERLLADAEKLSGVHYEIGNFADMVSAIHVIQENLGIAGTSAKEASTTITGSVNSMKAAWKNLLVGMADGNQDVGTLMDNFINAFKTAASNLAPRIVQALKGAGNLIAQLAPVIADQLPQLINDVLPSLIEATTTLIVGLIKALPTIFTTLVSGIVKALPTLFEAIVKTLPALISAIGEFLSKPENIGILAGSFGILFGASILKSLGGNLLTTARSGFKSLFDKMITKETTSGLTNGLTSSVDGLGKSLSTKIKSIGSAVSSAFKTIGDILKNVVNAVMEPIKALLKGVGEAIAGFFKAFASPEIAIGAAMFTVAAAAIAAAIFLIGSAIGAIMPVLTDLFNNIIMPIAQFIADTVLRLIEATTQAVIILTNEALIPLGEFLTSSFIAIIQTISDAITNLTQGALIPLINTVSGAFIGIIQTAGNVLTNILKVALEGIANVIGAVGDGFLKMGQAVKTALEGVQGVLSTFADLIKSIASAAVAMVAMVTNHSINYGNGYAHLFADGGRVTGAGTPTSDSIPAYLSDGEYVIRTAAAREIGYDNLDQLNETGRIGGGQIINFTINGYNKSPEELANIISRKIAFNQKGVIG